MIGQSYRYVSLYKTEATSVIKVCKSAKYCSNQICVSICAKVRLTQLSKYEKLWMFWFWKGCIQLVVWITLSITSGFYSESWPFDLFLSERKWLSVLSYICVVLQCVSLSHFVGTVESNPMSNGAVCLSIDFHDYATNSPIYYPPFEQVWFRLPHGKCVVYSHRWL